MSKRLSDLAIGSLVKTGAVFYGKPIIMRVMEHGHTGDPAGTTALEARDIISIRAFDAMEPNNSDSNRKQYGNNRYLHSNLLQWLNSDAAAGEWYTAQHTADQAPDSSHVWSQYNEYDQEAGFMHDWPEALKNALQTVSKVTAKNTVTDGGGYETVQSKIFLLSTTEVGLANENGVAEGSIYAYYSQSNTNARRVKKPTAECITNGDGYTNSSFNVNSCWFWWLRTPYSGYSYNARLVCTDGSLNGSGAYYGYGGVAPAFCLLSSLSVSDTTDSDGCYTIEWNAAPVVTTAADALGDKNGAFDVNFSINDSDGDAVGAVIALDGTTKQTITSVVLGQNYTFNVDNTTFRALSAGSHNITITATDSNGASAVKTLTFTRTTSTVTLSGADGDLGNKWMDPELTYQVGDSGGTRVDVVEKIDGQTSNTRSNVALDTDLTFDLSSFSGLSSEQSHTLVIEATNEDGNSATRTWTFTKLAEKLSFYTDNVPTDVAAKKINVALKYGPSEAGVKVEVTNNAMAIMATWEDATEAWRNGTAYEFTNKPSEDFGIAVRITITKTASTERVYCYSLGFSFA